MVSGGDVRLAFLHDVEMRVEGRGLEHFGERKLHLVGKRGEMRGGNLVIVVLDQMQMLDQEIAPPRPVAEQKFDLVRGRRIDLAALGRRLGAPPALARMLECADLFARHEPSKTSRILPRFASDSSLWHARCQENYARIQ